MYLVVFLFMSPAYNSIQLCAERYYYFLRILCGVVVCIYLFIYLFCYKSTVLYLLAHIIIMIIILLVSRMLLPILFEVCH